ncbi:telomere stability and silencing-domain-containing protein [Clohesyomyces aquaticus]|uniref:Telomere stability and silencing-domain-containing protein n=1 Tax=Clohesyomyces aquaticus TaxID=1231657 RepID=A0A1Y1ZMX1_9PLEO|nr:telomere stability and silencing-domain-containing protein [Clohesyomyces aquaticus]
MDPATQPSDSSPITIIINSLRGQNIAFATTQDCPLSSIYDTLSIRAPWIHNSTYILTTNARRSVSHSSSPISTLLTSSSDTFLPLRLTVPLCGGKGGFGSILRAQGGRMSSRKKRANGDANASSRNLDGRRLRTVAEAKALAEYMAAKPEMERREKEARRKKLEDTIKGLERREDEIREGRSARLDGKFVEDKSEAESKTREAVLAALKLERSSSEDEDEEVALASASTKKAPAPKTMFGWEDEDDEFMSDSEEEEDVSEEDGKAEYEGKGKGKAV